MSDDFKKPGKLHLVPAPIDYQKKYHDLTDRYFEGVDAYNDLVKSYNELLERVQSTRISEAVEIETPEAYKEPRYLQLGIYDSAHSASERASRINRAEKHLKDNYNLELSDFAIEYEQEGVIRNYYVKFPNPNYVEE